MLTLTFHSTGRPVYVNPFKIVATFEVSDERSDGTRVWFDDGRSITVAETPEQVLAEIERYALEGP